MKKHLVITSPALPGLALESIKASDIELLRGWKNANRHRFFHQEEIPPEGQLEWYSGYLERPDDWMFLIRSGRTVAGCAGYRITGGEADLYNLLREPSLARGSTAIALAFELLTNHIAKTHDVPIRGRILADNPAQRWFLARGFRVVGQGAVNELAFYVIEQDPLRRASYPVSVEGATVTTDSTREVFA